MDSNQRACIMLFLLCWTLACKVDSWVFESSPISRPFRPVVVPPNGRIFRRSFGPLYSTASSSKRSRRNPSRVTDPDGPTPQIEQDDIEEVDPETIEGLREVMRQDELPHPIPHQPWRRGSTDGCEDPIDADWRQAAERLIYTAVRLVGAQVVDITWFLTQVIITLDENMTVDQRDLFKSSGPVIDVVEPSDPLYYDPNDPDPEEIDDPQQVLYRRQTEEESEEEKVREKNRWAAKDAHDPPDEPHDPTQDAEPKVVLYRSEEGRTDLAWRATEEEQKRYLESEKRVDILAIAKIDTMALSTIAGVILEALEEVEQELDILRRHEIILASPGAQDVLETQHQFNAHRGSNVVVETQDPFNSNRILKGQLVDRNSMDLIINKKGRLVTIPHVFIKCVRIPVLKKKKDSQATQEDDEEDDEEED